MLQHWFLVEHLTLWLCRLADSVVRIEPAIAGRPVSRRKRASGTGTPLRAGAALGLDGRVQRGEADRTTPRGWDRAGPRSPSFSVRVASFDRRRSQPLRALRGAG